MENGKVKLFKLLSSETRFRILNHLLLKPDYTISIASSLGLDSSLVTHSLKALEAEGILETYRIKKMKYYGVANVNLLKNLLLSAEVLSEQSKRILERTKLKD